MKLTLFAIGSLVLGALATVPSSPVQAQSCNYYAGQAVNGQSINVDLCSISTASYRSVDFIYYLGNDRIQSQANCEDGSWITFPEKEIHRPQSQATQNMLDAVCNHESSSSTSPAGTAIVFDPPSNVRTAPNGDILCSVREPLSIDIYGSTGEWYYTDVCGPMGVIHSSQIRF